MKQSLFGKSFISKSGLLQLQQQLLLMINNEDDEDDDDDKIQFDNCPNFFSHAEVRDEVEELLELEV